MLRPEKAGKAGQGGRNLMDEDVEEKEGRGAGGKDKEVEDLGNELDRAFGRSEMG